MSHEKNQPTVSQQELASLAALGMLPAAERVHVPRELIDEMSEAAALLAEVVDPVPPPPSVREKLLTSAAKYEAVKPLAEVRVHDGAWTDAGAPGVHIKLLFQDKKGNSTMLVRMAPGSRFPAHRHHDDEQCLVISGDLRWGDRVYEEGDFVVMGKATTHPEIRTINGNLMLVVAGHNERVAG
jgi:quercetin dioxygenase-like cupin family protein